MLIPHNMVSVSLVKEAVVQGWSLLALRRAGFRVETLVEALGPQRVAKDGCTTPVEIYAALAGGTISDREALTPGFFINLGFSPEQLLGLFGPEELKRAGLSA